MTTKITYAQPGESLGDVFKTACQNGSEFFVYNDKLFEVTYTERSGLTGLPPSVQHLRGYRTMTITLER